MNQNYNASQEVSNILLTLGGPIIYELFWSLGHVRLTAIIYACILTWHITIVYTAWSNKFWTVDHRSLTSTYSFFQSWFRITRDVLVTKFLDISASSFCFFSSLSPLFLAKFRRGRNVCLPLFYNLKKLSEILNLVFTFMQILQNGFFDFSGRKFSNCFSRNLWDGIYKIWGKRKWLFQKRLIYKNYMWNSFVNL